QLHEMLIAPLAAVLADAESVVFVPSDVLHYIPFHALFDGTAYLIDRFPISYAPTATIYRLFTRKRPAQSKEAVLIGVPDEAAPSIATEIDSIHSVLATGKVFVGADATKDCLREQIQTAGIIH